MNRREFLKSLSLLGAYSLAADPARALPANGIYNPEQIIPVPVDGHTKDGWLTSGILLLWPCESDINRRGMTLADVERLIVPPVQEACRTAFSKLKSCDVKIHDERGREVPSTTMMRCIHFYIGRPLYNFLFKPGIEIKLVDPYTQNPPLSPEQQKRMDQAVAEAPAPDAN